MIRRSLSILFWTLFFFGLATVVGAFGWLESWRHDPITATLENPALSGAREPLVIDFSRSVRPDSLEGKISLTPDIPFALRFEDFDKRLIIAPDADWLLDTKYQLMIGQGEASLFTKTPIFSFSIAAPRLPRVVSLTPAAGAKDVVLGVEDPIRVEFAESVRNFFIDFSFEPPVEVVYQNNPEKTVFEILPKTPLLEGKTYTLSLRARFRNDVEEKFVPLTTTSFSTLPPRPARLNQDFEARLVEAKRFTRPKRTEGKYIDVNIAAQVMTLFEDGRAVDAYMISSGKAGMDTPKGDFQIHNQALRPWSKKYSLYMPHWQAITPDGLYGIHELPEWPGGYKEGANHLGTPVSHGCIRLGVGAAKRVYEWSAVGVPVVIY